MLLWSKSIRQRLVVHSYRKGPEDYAERATQKARRWRTPAHVLKEAQSQKFKNTGEVNTIKGYQRKNRINACFAASKV